MNALCELLGIELPVVQAPMAGAQGSRLALAVSNTGGLGSLPCALLGLGATRAELQRLKAGTSNPFNVNFFCHTPPTADAKREAAWRALLAPYYRELGLDMADASPGPARGSFNAEIADLLDEFRPAVVSFHFGLPAPDLLARVRVLGAKILSTATTVDEARWLESHGADAVIAQGMEAGGHRGHFLDHDLAHQAGTFELIPRIAQAVNIPVVAAGGIMDARDVAEALNLGAAGVQAGTAYLLCPESETSAVHRAALRSAATRDTALTNLFTGRPARGIVNRFMRELGMINAAAPEFPLAGAAVAPLRTCAESRGSEDFSPLWAGTSAAACRETSAADITRALAAEIS